MSRDEPPRPNEWDGQTAAHPIRSDYLATSKKGGKQGSLLRNKRALLQGFAGRLMARAAPVSGEFSCQPRPLPDVFTGVRLVLPPATTEKEALLRRYFVGYGGTVVTSEDESTHVLHTDGTAKRPTGRKDAKHVRKSWLWHSIRLQRLQPIAPYKVIWVK